MNNFGTLTITRSGLADNTATSAEGQAQGGGRRSGRRRPDEAVQGLWQARVKRARAAQRFGGGNVRQAVGRAAQRAEDEKRELQRALKGKRGSAGRGDRYESFWVLGFC